jgi:hypothetical protein
VLSDLYGVEFPGKKTMMSKPESPILCSAVAVHPSHATAERTRPHQSRAGSPLDELSSEVGHDRAIEEPGEFDSCGGYTASGAVSGAWLGWLLGLCIGEGILILPALGLVFARGSVLAAFLAGVEGGVAGALLGSLVGVLIDWKLRQKDTRRC